MSDNPNRLDAMIAEINSALGEPTTATNNIGRDIQGSHGVYAAEAALRALDAAGLNARGADTSPGLLASVNKALRILDSDLYAMTGDQYQLSADHGLSRDDEEHHTNRAERGDK